MPPVPPPSTDAWKSKPIVLEGGLVLNEDPLMQGIQKPGSLLQSVNFEPYTLGGYRRINGYVKYSTSQPNGTAQVMGVGILETSANTYVIAGVGTHMYSSTSTTWTKLDDNSLSTMGKVQFVRYGDGYAGPKIGWADSVNYPQVWDGTTWTKLSSAPQASTCIAEFNTSIFTGKAATLTWSAPGSENDYNSVDGAGSINCIDTIVGIITWQGALYVFSNNAIRVINGTSSANYTMSVITRNMGCIARDSIKELGGDVYFLSEFGIKSLASLTKLIDVDLGSLSRQVRDKINTIITTYTADQISAVSVRSKSQYRLFTSTNADTNSTAFGMLAGPRIPSQINAQYFITGNLGLEWHQMLGFVVACADSYVNGSSIELVVHGGFDGYVWKQESGYLLAGANTISSTLQTQYIILDDPADRTIIQRLFIYAVQNEGTVTPTLQINTGFGNDPIQPAAITGVDMTKLIEAQASGFNESFTITSNTNGDPCFILKSFNIQYMNVGRN